jgi:sigma-B regulation protein RsbU (phosphoserine phosphatase)
MCASLVYKNASAVPLSITNSDISRESNAMQPRILIADDQQDILDALRLLLKGHGYATHGVTSPADMLEVLAGGEFDLLLMDLNYARDTTSGQEGLDLLALLRENEDLPPVVVMTGWASVGLAVEAMQRGVADFVEKPWTNTRLLEILEKQIGRGRERRDSRRRAAEESQARKEMHEQLRQREQEIAEARAIQQGLLPKEIPQLTGYEIACAWQSALTVGGDYYDILPFGEEGLGLCIADVAGKGLPAAFLMANLQAAVRGLASPAVSPGALCARLNALLCRNTPGDRFITLFYAQLDGASRRLRYASAGHNPPILLRRDASHERLVEGGGVLGIFPEQSYAMGTVQLEPGDRVVFYTDGVTEANNPAGEEFGEERLLALLREHRGSSAGELQEIILASAAEFCAGHWHDDATLMILAVS